MSDEIPDPQVSRERREELAPIAAEIIKRLKKRLKRYDIKDQLALAQMLDWRMDDLRNQIDRKWERECYRPYTKALREQQKRDSQ